jgi:hypothetical protein
MSKKFNVKKMVDDLGGIIPAAQFAETYRTAPYRWIRTGAVSLKMLERIKSNCHRNINIDIYFEDTQ